MDIRADKTESAAAREGAALTSQTAAPGSVSRRKGGARRARSAAAPHVHWLDEAANWSVVGIFVLLAIFALKWGAFVAMPITVALAFGFTLGPLVDRLERYGLPPAVAAAIIVVALGMLLYGLFLAFAIPLEQWSLRVPEMLDKARVHLFALRSTLERLQEIGNSVRDAATPGEKPVAVELRDVGIVTNALASAPPMLAQAFILLGTFYFFLANRSRLRTWLLLLPVSHDARFRVARMFRDTEMHLSRYVGAITLINISLGLAVGIAMWLVGLPSPALWGALAGVLNFVPYLGPAIVAIVITGAALVTFDDLSTVVTAPAVFLALNLLESQFVTPSVIGHRLTLNPFLVFVALAFWVWMWGPVGAFLAVPLLIIVMVAVERWGPDGGLGSIAASDAGGDAGAGLPPGSHDSLRREAAVSYKVTIPGA